jgi:phage tail protein X
MLRGSACSTRTESRFPQYGRQAEAELIDVVCARVADFERLLDSAIAALHIDAGYGRAVCEPYLRVAFPAGLPDPADVSRAQRAFAPAAVDREEIWAPEHRGWAASLDMMGLPTDRATWSAVGMSWWAILGSNQ